MGGGVPSTPTTVDQAYGTNGGSADAIPLMMEIFRDVKASDTPRTIERILKAYLAHRAPKETFLAFARRHETEALKAMMQPEAVA